MGEREVDTLGGLWDQKYIADNQTLNVGISGTMVRRWAYTPRVVGSIPALTTFEDNILGKVLTQILPLSI